jgi:hypothetical protein
MMTQTAPRLLLLLSCLLSLSSAHGTVINAAIVVYGATPAGVTAALSAAASLRQNKGDREEEETTTSSVVLVAMQSRVGGMTAGGLGHMDCALGAREVGGLVREFLANCASVYNGKRRK